MVSSIDQTETLEDKSTVEKPLVLIVDDNPDYARLFDLLSDQLGITTRIVNSCEEALRAMEKDHFDLVIMDWLMPEVDGPACARKIRSKEARTGTHVTIVGVSGYDGASRDVCLQSGMDDFLGIPFTLEVLREKLNYWIQRQSKSVDS